jgi:Na+-transporting NADH:ubiquinone oxidoreductase subunit NqrB
MPTLNVFFTFDTTSEGFTSTSAASVTGDWFSGDGHPSSGSLQKRITGKNQNTTGNIWTRTLTFETMGVPAGATITAITAGSSWSRCNEYVTGSGTNQQVGVSLIVGGNTYSISGASANFTAVSDWAQQTGTNATGLSLASTASCEIRSVCDLRTGASASAAVSILVDTIAFTVTYDTPPLTETVSDTVAVSEEVTFNLQGLNEQGPFFQFMMG